jgi:ubiquitin-small subunit ribosomal protein S27Ae
MAKHKHKPGTSTNKYSKYKTEGDKLSKGKTCPKCGPAIFVAEHKDRISCGRCGYTEKLKQ